jgi:glycosyltransferase involved in cell wall biosynthesis
VAAARGLAGAWRYLRLAHRLGKRVAWTVHDLDHLDDPARADRVGNAVLGRMADLTICHSEQTRDRLVREFRVPARNVVVMPIGNFDGVYPPPRPRAETLARLGLAPGRRTLAAVGLVRSYKGFDLAVEAARELGDGYQLVVAGVVPAAFPEVRADLEARAAAAPNVRLLLDPISDADVADIHAAADCALLPYRAITGSAALLTAVTLGVGVVASDLPFFREVLDREPAAGEVCPVGDAAGLAAAVRRFFDRPPGERGRAARRLADGFAWDRVIRPVADRVAALFPPAAVPAGGRP